MGTYFVVIKISLYHSNLFDSFEIFHHYFLKPFQKWIKSCFLFAWQQISYTQFQQLAFFARADQIPAIKNPSVLGLRILMSQPHAAFEIYSIESAFFSDFHRQSQLLIFSLPSEERFVPHTSRRIYPDVFFASW